MFVCVCDHKSDIMSYNRVVIKQATHCYTQYSYPVVILVRFELYVHTRTDYTVPQCTRIACTRSPTTHALSGLQPFDDVQYSEVRKGPFYKPKSTSTDDTPSPPPPKTDDGGISELDNLLAMLSDTQKNIQEGKLYSSPTCLKLCFCTTCLKRYF